MEEWGLSWYRRIVAKANDWESDSLIDLLITSILRISPEERLSIDTYLAKGFELGVFYGYSYNSGITILLDALCDTSNNRKGYRNPDYISRILESRSLYNPSSPSNRNYRGLQLGSFGSAFNPQRGGLKRQRSPAEGSANNSQQRSDQTSTKKSSVSPTETKRRLSERNIHNNLIPDGQNEDSGKVGRS